MFDTESLAEQFGLSKGVVKSTMEAIGNVVSCRPTESSLGCFWSLSGEPDGMGAESPTAAAFTLAYHLCRWPWITLSELMEESGSSDGWSRARVYQFVNVTLARVLPLWSCGRCAGPKSDTVWVWVESEPESP